MELKDFPGGSDGKESACNVGFYPWVRRIPWRRKWQPTPIFLPGKSHGQRSLAGNSSWGRKRVGHNSVTKQNKCFKNKTAYHLHQKVSIPVWQVKKKTPPNKFVINSCFRFSKIHIRRNLSRKRSQRVVGSLLRAIKTCCVGLPPTGLNISISFKRYLRGYHWNLILKTLILNQSIIHLLILAGKSLWEISIKIQREMKQFLDLQEFTGYILQRNCTQTLTDPWWNTAKELKKWLYYKFCV